MNYPNDIKRVWKQRIDFRHCKLHNFTNKTRKHGNKVFEIPRFSKSLPNHFLKHFKRKMIKQETLKQDFDEKMLLEFVNSFLWKDNDNENAPYKWNQKHLEMKNKLYTSQVPQLQIWDEEKKTQNFSQNSFLKFTKVSFRHLKTDFYFDFKPFNKINFSKWKW